MKFLGVFVLALVIALVRGEGATPQFPSFNVTLTGEPPKGGVGSHIVGGTLATTGLFPWQAGLIMTKSTGTGTVGYTLCGGSLIHPQWVLTAAHCTINAMAIQVTLGSLSYNSGGTIVNAVQIQTHASYNPSTLANDVGLVKLPSAITLSTIIKTIKLASTSTAVTTLTVSGWGRTCTSCSISANLLFAAVKAISNTQCTSYYQAGLVTANTICTLAQTTAANQSPCFGDSGGPLVKTGTTPLLVGVVSFVSSVGCDKGGTAPAGYMRAANFCAWIKLNIPGFIC